MALINNPRSRYDKARQDAAAAREKAATFRAEATQLEADAADQILADESAADRIVTRMQSLKLKAAAFDKRASQEDAKAADARGDLLRDDAAAADKEAQKLDRDADKARQRSDELRKTLEDFDGCTYAVNEGEDREEQIRAQALITRRRAVVTRYFAVAGSVPTTWAEMTHRHGDEFRKPVNVGANAIDVTHYVDRASCVSALVAELEAAA